MKQTIFKKGINLLLIAAVLMTFVPMTLLADAAEMSKSVEYTKEEQDTLDEVRQIYAKSVNLYNNAKPIQSDSFFDINPDISKTPLTAGKMNVAYSQAATEYLNAVRVGGGLSKLYWSEEITEAAQHKAALVRYCSSIGAGAGHYPAKPEGVSDEFYDKAMSYMNENLYMAGYYGGDPISSIMYALHDGHGDPIMAGHRYNLLAPSASHFGIGLVDVQAAHKLSLNQNSDVEMVAWPSKGIMLEEADAGRAYWTARFYKNYKVTAETNVTVTLLNTGETWEFNSSDKNTGSHEYHINDNMVSFLDISLEESKEIGNVYQITLDNLTGADTTYSYRSVYEMAYPDRAEKYVIEASSGLGGSVSPSGSVTVTEGESWLFYISPDDGYEILDVLVDGKSVGAFYSYTFYDIDEPHTIKAIFRDLSEKLPWSNPFVDVSQTDWFYDSVKFANQNNLFEGTSDTTFSPKGTMTRGMMVTVLHRLDGLPAPGEPVFTDIPKTGWYTDAVNWAAANGIVEGMGGNWFFPHEIISREQMAVILYRYCEHKGIELPATRENVAFSDSHDISNWAADAVDAMYAAEIINGIGNARFNPKGKASRSEVATMFMNFAEALK